MKNTTKTIVYTAMFAALTCIATILIKIPSPLNGYINFGDAFVLLGAWFLSPVCGMCAAGVGSALADLFSGYVVYAPATFFIKAAMSVTAYVSFALLSKKCRRLPSRILSGIFAESVMILGYYLFEGALYGFAASLVNIPFNGIQGAAGILTATLLYKILEKSRSITITRNVKAGKIYRSVDQLIGKTPLLELTRIEKHYALKAKLLAKLEYFNPAGSVKDRVAKAMLDEAEASGKLSPDSVIIEPTSGNTGIGLASVASARGYRVIVVMPETMSEERKKLMKAYGAELVLTEGKQGMQGAIRKAHELAESIPRAFIAGQFENPANPKIHFRTTGPEIYEDTDGQVDIFVAGVGTGGTITGVGGYLKSKNADVRIVAVEPASSPVLSVGKSGTHKIQGIGAGFVPEILDTKIYDEVISVTDEEAFEAGKQVGKREGVLVGISSGAALHAAIQLAKRPENEGKTIVVLFPDTGDRYLSTAFFDN